MASSLGLPLHRFLLLLLAIFVSSPTSHTLATSTSVSGNLFTKKCRQRCGLFNLGSRMRRVTTESSTNSTKCSESCVYLTLLSATILGRECGTCNATAIAPNSPTVPAAPTPTLRAPSTPSTPTTPTPPTPTPPTPTPPSPIPPMPTMPMTPLAAPMASPPAAPSAPTVRAGVVCDVAVAVGSTRSNAAGKFVNVAVNQSLANVVNCLGPNEGEVHSQTTHVWWNPSPLELVFTFTKDYDLSKVLFWNYNTEDYDVDSMLLEFYNATGQVIGSFNVGALALGRIENGLNMAETIAFSNVYRNVRRVSAILNATNGELDFQNLLFVV